MKRSRKKTTVGDIIWRIIFLAALAVFCYCGYRLLTIYLEYKAGTDEYSALEEQYVAQDGWSDDEELDDGGADNSENGGTGINGDGTERGTVSGNEPGSDTDSSGNETDRGGKQDSSEAGNPVKVRETETEVQEDEEGRKVIKTYQVMRNPIDFDSLKKVNEDIIGWIRVNALDISYPIAQGTDNDFYLHRTFEKEENFAGCIFMEYQNNSDFSDKNTIIYGHNMKNGSMFGTLRKFYEDGVYESAPYFWIYTPDKIYKYEIFSCAEVGVSSLTYQITFSEEEDFAQYIDDAYNRSVVDGTGIKVTTDDKIVTLSTCTGNEATRFVVQGKLAKTYKSAKK